ncbi:unnamed protein product [Spirodela intermedia]|uniref:Uncharacterized protein n=1 Tax=Spirodela intermedia TaxID=51605 RepID=A0A7I8JCX4_SPIIN|nr:unnamed protein product [Spirodela intermedia]CAA6667841.1 unnamed protein product [Spirodela intermedia]
MTGPPPTASSPTPARAGGVGGADTGDKVCGCLSSASPSFKDHLSLSLSLSL